MRFFKDYPIFQQTLQFLILAAQAALLIAYEVTGLQLLYKLSKILDKVASPQLNDELTGDNDYVF